MRQQGDEAGEVVRGWGGGYQDVQTRRLEQGDLVGDGERGEARYPLGKLHNLDDALGGQLTELVPQAQVQLHPVVRTGILGQRRKGKVKVLVLQACAASACVKE